MRSLEALRPLAFWQKLTILSPARALIARFSPAARPSPNTSICVPLSVLLDRVPIPTARVLFSHNGSFRSPRHVTPDRTSPLLIFVSLLIRLKKVLSLADAIGTSSSGSCCVGRPPMVRVENEIVSPMDCSCDIFPAFFLAFRATRTFAPVCRQTLTTGYARSLCFEAIFPTPFQRMLFARSKNGTLRGQAWLLREA